MLVNLRNAMMAGKRLPYDAELEYLESTGTQWIDTGVKLNLSTDSIRMCIKPLTTDTSIESYWGVYETIDGVLRYTDLRHNKNATNVNAYWPKETSPYYRTNAAFDNDAKWHSIDYNVSGMVVDGTSISMSDVYAVAFSLPLFVFATNSSGSSIQKAKAQIASFSVVRNGVLVRDFIPVRKGTVGYLYDRVTSRIFGNSGTGDFVLGPDVVPVEYIESYGTEWIDTGFKANTTTTRFECGIVPNDILTTQGVFGSRNSPNTAAHDACNIFVISGSFRLDWGSGNGTNPYTATVGQDYTMSITRGIATINGTNITSENTQSITQDNNFLIGNFTNGSGTPYSTGFIGKWKWAKLYSNDNAAYSFRPVRVGTGSTWAGAMMDVLTRRVYRNAGTGAFTYGNDLKHPIPSE